MNKQDKQQLAIQQYAMIWNYNAYVEHQHFHYGVTPEEEADEDNSDTKALEVVDDEAELGEQECKEEQSDDLVERLKPIFFNNENDVRLFLKEISGMQPNNITDLVNTWVQDKRISDYGSSRKGDLWKILHDAKLYPRTIQNWNRRVF
jgi:hypothetical protein